MAHANDVHESLRHFRCRNFAPGAPFGEEFLDKGLKTQEKMRQCGGERKHPTPDYLAYQQRVRMSRIWKSAPGMFAMGLGID